MSPPSDMLQAAETVVEVLRRRQVDAVVIGAAALAAYRYIRYTEDLDLGVDADVTTLRAVRDELLGLGYAVELREPDGADPLGGVLDVSGPFGLLQVISYAARFPAVIQDALSASRLVVREGSSLRLVPLPHLVALKLYAGGSKSKADVVELLKRNPDTDMDEIRRLCAAYRLAGFDERLAEARAETRAETINAKR